jgi:HD-like signal output (HDOD) protein
MDNDYSLHLPSLMELVERLPPFHKVMERCMVTMSKPYASAREISGWIESDSALSGKVLSLANSSFYGQPQKVLRTERAVVLLGRRALEEVFFSFYIQGLFAAQEDSEVADLWTASLSGGICAKELTLVLGLPSAEGHETPDAGAYLAGLLHDSGKLLVLTHYPEAYASAALLSKQEGLSPSQAEARCWGFDHAQLSLAMAEKWALPESVCRAIAFHHEPLQAGDDALLACLVRAADILCQALVDGRDVVEALDLELGDDGKAILGVTADNLPFMRKVMRSVKEKMQVYGGLMNTGFWQTP